jgi:hypothetical protein
MRTLKVIRSTAVMAVLTFGVAASAAAQSLTSVRGPGYPLLPADARTALMGGLGVGLQGLASPLTNPAAHARATRRGAVVAVEAIERNVRLGQEEDDIGTTRFPLIQLVFPAGAVVLNAGYGGYLDQSWGLSRQGEQELGGVPVGVTDVMRSEGGVGRFQVGAAMPIGSRLGVGAAVGLHMGSQRLEYSRRFDGETGSILDPYAETLSWRYRGPMAQVGVQWDPADIVRVGASVTWAGTLVGEPVEGRAERRELDLPLQVAAGASGVLVPGLLAAVSGRWSGWSVTDHEAIGLPGAAPGGASRDTWELGGGLEWAPVRPAARRTYPLRVGAQVRQLPFPFAGEAPTEWFAGAGAGLRIGTDPRNPLGSLDLAVQRGTRTAAGDATVGDLTERMWRFTLSVSVFGN